MTIHFSIQFTDDPHTYHGEVDMPYVRKENTEKNKDYIITECKKQFIRDCERWGVDAKAVSSFECYYFDKGKEKPIFRWKLKQMNK